MSDAWETFTADLVRHLDAMGDLDTRIYTRGAYYVQVQAGLDDLAVETSSNLYLPDGAKLTAEAEQALRDLGWNEPDADDDEYNWHRAYPRPLAPSDADDAARLITRTIQAVLGPTDPADMELTEFNAG